MLALVQDPEKYSSTYMRGGGEGDNSSTPGLPVRDGVFPRVAGPRPGAPGTAVRQPSTSVFLPSAPQCGYVGFLAEWWPRGSEHDYLVAGSPRVSIRETLEGSIRLLVTQLQKSWRHFYHIQTIIKRCVYI